MKLLNKQNIMKRKKMKTLGRRSKNPNEKVWNINKIKMILIEIEFKRKISFMKRRKNKRFLKIIHLTSKIMIIKKCSGRKFDKIWSLKMLITRNSCLDNKISKFKKIRFINMVTTPQGHHFNNLSLKTIMILDSTLIFLKIRKKSHH